LPYPEFWGVINSASIGDADSAERNTPVDQVITTQQDVNFVWQADPFDSYARPITVTRTDGRGNARTETTAYSDNTTKWVLGQIASVTESSTGKAMVSNTYDATTATLATASKFGKLQETHTYNADGTLWKRADAASQTTTYTSYKAGIAQNTAYPNSTSESVVVNAIGLITSSTNGAGYTTTYGYDAMGRLSSVTPPAGDTTVWNAYSLPMVRVTSDEFGLAAGHWRQTVSTGNGRSVTYYDALWRPVLTRAYDYSDEANTRSMVLRRYDHNGNVTFESYPQRNISTIYDTLDGRGASYDALGRVTQVVADSEIGDLYTSISYDSDFRKSVTNPRGAVVTSGYQTFDTPSEQALTSTVESYGVGNTIVRDVFGKPLSITRGNGIDQNVTRRYVYDTYARLCKTIEPETGATVQDYDTAGNVAWRAIGLALPGAASCDQASVAAAKKITYGYDQRYWLKTTTYGDASPSISRTYHGDGLPATVSSNGTVWTYTYNKRRLLTKESLAYASKTYDITRGYDANGAPSQLTYPGGSGTSIAYSPNGLGQPTQVGSYAVGVHHHPNGAVAYFDYGNGVARTMTQNKRGLPDEVRDVGVLWDDYSYDANGNVAGITDKQESVSTRSMTYDYLDRLATVNAPAMWGNMVIGTDLLDNVNSVSIPSGLTARTSVINYDAATNRVSSITGSAPAVSFAYDSQGNITTRGTAGYVFDQGNRLTSATGKASYVYDGLGRRVKTTKTDGTNLIHVYSQAGELLYSSTAVGAATPVETLYVNLNGHLLAEVGGAYVHTDGLGSPIARTNAARTVISRTRYEPYGLTASDATPTVGYTGHVNDADTGLVYMQQRYYDPVAARFLSIDPVVTDANTGTSFNRYAYAANSPYKYTDPDGRQERAAEGFGAAMARDPRSMEAFAPAAAVVTAVMAAPVAFELGMAALTNPVAVNSAVVTLGEAVGVTGTAGVSAVAGKEAVAVAGKITGYTKHGLNQAISRDGGRGVSPTAILSAVKDPAKVTEQAGGKVAYTGKDAKVVLNGDGKVITIIPKNSEASRDPNVK
jgi:RHS repeat-associated protein